MARIQTVLRIDTTVSGEASNTRRLADSLIEKLNPETVTVRDMTAGLPFLTPDWVGANFTPEENRTDEQKKVLALSDALIEEIEAADSLVIGVPIYNYNIPATLKIWVDLISRARRTFQYTENGPEGLIKGKKVYLMIASGGTKVGSEIEFATPYLKHALGVLGMDDIEIIAADAMAIDAEQSMKAAEAKIEQAATKVALAA